MKPNYRFVDIVDTDGRKSSLALEPGKIEVIGVLQHCSKIEPDSVKDAELLREWLNEWIIEQLEKELDNLRTPRGYGGKRYLGIAQHNADRIREIRKQLSELDK